MNILQIVSVDSVYFCFIVNKFSSKMLFMLSFDQSLITTCTVVSEKLLNI